MTAECQYLNPLRRDGTSQMQRLVKALRPSHVKIDGRDPGELLRYARDYGKLLRFYAANDKASGDWAGFFERDISVGVALIGTQAEDQRHIFLERRDAAFHAAAHDRAHRFIGLFEPLLDLAQQFDAWYQHSDTGVALKGLLERLIRSLLGDALREAASFVARIEDPTVLGAADAEIQAFFDRWTRATDAFTKIWALAGVSADGTLLPHGVNASDDDYAAAVQRVSEVFDRFQEALAALVHETPFLFRETIQKYPRHQPHIALFLTFLRLFRYAQKDLNAVTAKHLDFYFKEVLQLQPAAGQPDKVHVVFELAKNVAESQHLIPKDTLLLGGKDARKLNVYYGTDSELVVNRAEIDAAQGLKTLFAERVSRGSNTVVTNLYAADDADSADGRGAPLKDADGKWLTFGSDAMPYARLGFAIASPMFLLSQGVRTIAVQFSVDPAHDFFAGEDPPTVQKELKHNVKVQASGAKGWIDLETQQVEFVPATGPVTAVKFTFTLQPGAAAIVGFDSKTLKEALATTLPVVRFLCDSEGLSARLMDLWGGTDIPEYSDSASYPRLSFVREGGQIYRANTDVTKPHCGPSEKPEFWDLYHEKDIPDYSGATPSYRRLAFVRYKANIYRAKKDINQAGMTPDEHPGLWEPFGDKAIPDYSDSTSYYPHLSLVRYQRKVYRAKLGITKPGYRPGNYPQFWDLIALSNPYKYFERMELQGLSLTVQVGDLAINLTEANMKEGMRSLVLENDFGALDPAKPFFPFGPIPRSKGSFLVGSHEAFQKPLTQIRLHVQWADVPSSDFKTYYSNYFAANQNPVTNAYFTAAFSLRKRGTWASLSTPALFQDADATQPRDFKFDNLALPPDPGLKPFSRFEESLPQGFLKATLQQNFFHWKYPSLLAAATKGSGNDPNPPYTPLIASLDLAYEATQAADYAHKGKHEFEGRVERIFQLGPFGYREIYPISDDPTATGVPICRKLVPEFTVMAKQRDGSVRPMDVEGTLFLGIAQLKPPQNLALLFQVAEGSEDPDIPAPPQVVWSHLDADRWVDFQAAEVVSDGTNGLLTSGVIQFAMPDTMTNANTSMPAGLHWIKASVADRCAGIPKLIAIHTQAVVASFRDQGNDPAHLAAPLPAKTIAKLKNREAAIKSVTQPYASFGGRMPESSKPFAIRTSERLRHKQRAVTIFDYERLVLRQFPEVYKVKCINHTRAGSECAPGYVRIVVMPNLRNRNAVDPLRPRLSLNKLWRIQQFLTELASDFTTIEVANPDYEEVKVHFDVRFRPGKDKGFYTAKLNQDIIRFLSPWLYDEAADLTLGGRVHRSSILNWIEETDYVDFVTNFQMDHITATTVYANVEEAISTHSGSAIVSAEQHDIGDNIVSCEDRAVQPAQVMAPAAAKPGTRPVVVPSGFERYMGNVREAEVHDLMNLQPQCQIEEIPSAWRTYFPTVEEALRQGYDYCAYCFARELSKR